MNPYYAMAAIFALGLRGIEQKRPLPYGPIGSPGVSRDTVKHLPTSLDTATQAFMKKDSLAREAFGNFFVDHYGGTREHEVELHRKAVTDWEGKWMLFRRAQIQANLVFFSSVARYFELV